MTASQQAPDLEVVVVDAEALRLDPGNARKHGRKNLDAIKGSLEQFGQRRPLVVMPDMTVIAGNGTLEAARALGWTRVAVTVVPADWTTDQARAYALADNRTAELAEWDETVLAETLAELDAGGWDLNSIGFDGLPEIASGDEDDEVPEPPEVTVCSPGDVWILGEHRLVCGSSVEEHLVAALFGERLADAVVTDPPYGVSYVSPGRWVKNKHRAIANDDAQDAELLELVRDALTLAWAHSREGGAAYVFHADVRREVFVEAMRGAGYFLHQTLLWVKDQLVLSRMDYQPLHEPILYGWKPGGSHVWFGGCKRTTVVADLEPDFAAMDREELLAFLQDLYSTSSVIRHDRPKRSAEHPTMKPVGLLSRLIVNSTAKGGLVYDPFLGSGSTLIACERQGRVCYGVELDPAYCDVIVHRWENVTGRKAVRA